MAGFSRATSLEYGGGLFPRLRADPNVNKWKYVLVKLPWKIFFLNQLFLIALKYIHSKYKH